MWEDISVTVTYSVADSNPLNSYQIAIFTNQGSISLRSDPKTVKSDQRNLIHFKAKVAFVLAQLDFPVNLYAATIRDQYRKPRTRMWHELLEDIDLDMHGGPDFPACFFVGDAGGRPARKDAKADHASSDRLTYPRGFSAR